MALKLDIIKKRVNYVGILSKNRLERFSFFSLAGRASNGNLLVRIQNKINKKTKIAQYSDLVNSLKNPFNLSKERHEEEVVHPKIKQFLKKMNLIIEQEVKISNRSRVDFVCTNRNGRKILIEVKSDKKHHSSKQLSEQISRYKNDGKKKYGNNYAKTYLVSLKGKYGYSISDLSAILKQEGLIWK